MGFPLLIAAIRSAGLPQWRLAQLIGWSESRLSRVIRRGIATPDEREQLSRLLGLSEEQLFALGPMIALNIGTALGPSTARPATPTIAPLPTEER